MNSNVSGSGAAADDGDDVKKSIAIFAYKQRILSIDMKTKVFQQVETDWMSEWESERIREWEGDFWA